MDPISFPEVNTVFGEGQPEYRPFPTHHTKNQEGQIIACWKLSFRERLKILFTGKMWHSIYTFYGPLQPQLLAVDKPEMTSPGEPQQAQANAAASKE